MATFERWRSYWGKARGRAGGAPFHGLPLHSLDVSAVGVVLLRSNPRLLAWLSGRAGFQDPEAFVAWFAFWLAVHDIGKFSATFQALRADLVRLLKGRAAWPVPLGGVRHDSLGAWAWHGFGREALLQRHPSLRPHAEFLALWASASMGHHGQPPQPRPAGGAWLDDHFPPEDRAAACAFIESMSDRFLTAGVVDQVAAMDELELESRWSEISWWVAGLAVLADWIGSDSDRFAYEDRLDVDLDAYWADSLSRAAEAVKASGVTPAAVRAESGLADLFPYIQQASPLQRWAQTVALADAPQIHLLEDVTGAGKTEAAVMLTHRLMAAGLADGFFIGLPTMATANAMYARLAKAYLALFDGVASLALAHGRKDMVRTFAHSVLQAGPQELDPAQPPDTASASCTRWLADHNKRALLAAAGVGTIDQALMAALQCRHQSLRLVGLFGKVLVVDEVHACDSYMQGVLERLLEAHAQAGGSAILMSATLPAAMKVKLLKAYARGRGHVAPVLTTDAYPLATSWPAVGLEAARAGEQAIDTRPDVARSLTVHIEPDLAKVVDRIVAALDAGQCVAWIRNTVIDVLVARALLAGRVDDKRMLVFHARFALADRLEMEGRVLGHFGPASTAQTRRGMLLLASQVAEQSLDADVDFLVSDLAPIDRLIQRAGRLRRHVRSSCGDRLHDDSKDQRGEPEFWIHAPAWVSDPPANWVQAALPGTSRVYNDPGQLWLTMEQLRQGRLVMPADARRMVDRVFAADADIPAALQRRSQEALAQSFADRSFAQASVISLPKGYRRDALAWQDDVNASSRLGEPAVEVALGHRVGDEIKPLRDDGGAHAWAYSSLSLPRRLIASEAPTRDRDEAARIERAKAGMPGSGKWVVLIVLSGEGQGPAVGQAVGPDGQVHAWCYGTDGLTRLR